MRGTGDEHGRRGNTVQRKPLAREAQKRFRDVDADEAGAAVSQENAVFAVAAAQIEDDLARDIPEKMKDVLERKRRVRLRIHVAPEVRFGHPKTVQRGVRRLRSAPGNLGLFPDADVCSFSHSVLSFAQL